MISGCITDIAIHPENENIWYMTLVLGVSGKLKIPVVLGNQYSKREKFIQ